MPQRTQVPSFQGLKKRTEEPPNKGHLGVGINSADLFLEERFSSLGARRFKMYCRNFTGTISCVLCREVCYTVSLFGARSPLLEVPLYTAMAGCWYWCWYIVYVVNFWFHTCIRSQVPGFDQGSHGFSYKGRSRVRILCLDSIRGLDSVRSLD